MLEFLFEVVGTVLIEFAFDIPLNKRIPRWQRIILAVLILLFTSGILVGITVLGVIAGLKGNIFGWFVVVFGIALTLGMVSKVYKEYLKQVIK